MINLSNKNILFCDADGNFSAHSSDEVIAKKLNSWKGWKCSAGVNSIYITADGNIYTGTCKVDDLRGNVYDSGVLYPNHWCICTKEFCNNKLENQLFKSKNHDENVGHQDLKNFSLKTVDPLWVGPANVKKNNAFPLTITWDIGRRCNYECSYCPQSISNTFETHKSLGSLRFAIKNIHQDFCRGKKATWNFSGGEPTTNPAYFDIVKHIVQDLGHAVNTQSNGSQNEDYYTELIEYSSIVLSAHLDKYNQEQFITNCQAIIEKKSSTSTLVNNLFFIKVMTPPGKTKEALELKEKLLSLPNIHEVAAVSLILIKQQSAVLYTPEELMAIKRS